METVTQFILGAPEVNFLLGVSATVDKKDDAYSLEGLGCPGSSDSKKASTCNAEDPGSIPGSEDHFTREKETLWGMPQASCATEDPLDGETHFTVGFPGNCDGKHIIQFDVETANSLNCFLVFVLSKIVDLLMG